MIIIGICVVIHRRVIPKPTITTPSHIARIVMITIVSRHHHHQREIVAIVAIARRTCASVTIRMTGTAIVVRIVRTARAAATTTTTVAAIVIMIATVRMNTDTFFLLFVSNNYLLRCWLYVYVRTNSLLTGFTNQDYFFRKANFLKRL